MAWQRGRVLLLGLVLLCGGVAQLLAQQTSPSQANAAELTAKPSPLPPPPSLTAATMRPTAAPDVGVPRTAAFRSRHDATTTRQDAAAPASNRRCFTARGVYRQVVVALYASPDVCLEHSTLVTARLDQLAPHTHLDVDVAKYVIGATFASGYYVEVGAFRGGSTQRLVQAARESAPAGKALQAGDFVLHSMDPFTGDVAMNVDPEFQPWLRRIGGLPYLAHQYIANLIALGITQFVFPHQVTSLVGLRSVERLLLERRLAIRPDAIYLDSAHERNETLLEVAQAYALLPPGGIVFGDDFNRNWHAMVADVVAFASHLDCGRRTRRAAACATPWPSRDPLPPPDAGCVVVPPELHAVLRVAGACQWLIRKVEA